MIRFNRFRNQGRLLAVVLWACLGIAGPLCGQPPAAASVPAAAPGGVIQQQTKPFYVEGFIVLALVGGAVFTVCRSSRRQ
jgi:hypothetical protein